MSLNQQIFAKCKIVKAVANRGHQSSPFPEFGDNLNSRNMEKAHDAISAWQHYHPTPLISLDKLADFCGIAGLLQGRITTS